MSDCPSCGRYVGPYEACPYCGARIGGRVSVRAVKIAAIVLATVGLAALWLAATHSEVPLVPIGQAGATMNMAYVRVQGRVIRSPSYYADSGYLAFTIADESGQMRVSAYRHEAEALRSGGRVPALGDWVSVEGTLRVREDDVAMTINVPEHLEIERPEAALREIGSLSADDQYARVRVQGQVWAVREPYEGLTLLTLRDASGTVEVAVDESLQALTGALIPPAVGQSVEVAGAIDLYGDTPQIVPASVLDIVLLPEPVVIAPPVNIGALSEADAGRLVSVQGTITGVDPFSAGVKFTLDDGTGTLTLLLWQDLFDALPDPAALAEGAQVQALGTLSLYRGALELTIERAQDVTVVGGATAPVSGPTAIGELTADRLGETVTVEGAVVEVASSSSNFRFTLDDGSGQVVLLLWLDTYDELADPRGLNVGARVRATGQVDEYQGALQVVPSAADDVTLLAPPTSVALRDVSSLSAADVGGTVALQGLVARAEPFSQGYRLWLNDGTGEALVLLWSNVYERVDGRDGLVVGAQVHVVGLVQEYQGTLEVVPQLPVDVVVGGP